MDIYTNVTQKGNKLLVCGYLNGKRYKHVVHYKPYLYVPSKEESEWKDIFGANVKRLNFDSIKEARDFVRQYQDLAGFKFFGMERFAYAYISDEYPGELSFDVNQFKVHWLDIETDSKGGFADIQTANKAVTLIGIGYKKHRIVFGYKEHYSPKDPNVLYIHCKDEMDMLRKFLNFWSDEETRPDIVSGWNVEGYDIPYLVNRIKNQLGEDEALKMSPWGILDEKTIEWRGRETQAYIPVGVTVLDYLPVFRKFHAKQEESFTLDHIAYITTGKRKLDYSEYDSLQDLYEKNYEKFVDYNLADVERVIDIDKKKNYLELALTMAYDAKVNPTDALTSVLLWDVIIYNFLKERKIIIPKSMRTEPRQIPGGYVKEPLIGAYKWTVGFDFESLYPKTMMQYNISPDAFRSYESWGMAQIDALLEGQYSNTSIKEKDLCQAMNGARFDIKKAGFIAEIVGIQFAKRKEYKDKMKELRRANPEDPLIQKYDSYQLAKKIQINSLYGAFANEYFRWYDYRLASAVTLTGQTLIRWMEKKFNAHFNEVLGTQGKDYVIAMDTDSCYVSFENMETRLPFVDNISEYCEKVLQPKMDGWLKEFAELTNAYQNVMYMKREAIADRAIWKAKKMYVMNVLDNEGERYDEPKLKMLGIEAVKAIIPQVCRDALKDAIKILLRGTEPEVHDFVRKFWEKFNALPFEDIAFPRGMQGLAKYADPVIGWKSGTPIHVKASIVYNSYLKRKGLHGRYPLIQDKDKIKFAYLKVPNPTQGEVIACPRQMPKELEIDQYIDRRLMFDKTFKDPLSSLLEVIGWHIEPRMVLQFEEE